MIRNEGVLRWKRNSEDKGEDVALQRRRDGERRRTKREEFESGTKLRATRERIKKVGLESD